jgi:hypothetical protein
VIGFGCFNYLEGDHVSEEVLRVRFLIHQHLQSQLNRMIGVGHFNYLTSLVRLPITPQLLGLYRAIEDSSLFLFKIQHVGLSTEHFSSYLFVKRACVLGSGSLALCVRG